MLEESSQRVGPFWKVVHVGWLFRRQINSEWSRLSSGWETGRKIVFESSRDGIKHGEFILTYIVDTDGVRRNWYTVTLL